MESFQSAPFIKMKHQLWKGGTTMLRTGQGRGSAAAVNSMVPGGCAGSTSGPGCMHQPHQQRSHLLLQSTVCTTKHKTSTFFVCFFVVVVVVLEKKNTLLAENPKCHSSCLPQDFYLPHLSDKCSTLLNLARKEEWKQVGGRARPHRGMTLPSRPCPFWHLHF